PYNLNVWTPNYNEAILHREQFINNGQIDWNAMYAANAKNGRAIYALYEDRVEDDLLTANSIVSSQLSDNISFNGGVTFRSLHSENFQYMLDLLGDNPLADTDVFYT